jgi:hypothetical protein
MNAYRAKPYGYLDRIRLSEGAERCRAVFQEACETNRRWAAGLLNDERLTFPCLFLLWRQAEAFQLSRFLSPRCLTALELIRQMLGQPNTSGGGPSLRTDSRMTHAVLKWILETGKSEYGLGDVQEYEEIVDKAASVLINVYKDKSVLPNVVELVFDRNREGRHVHTLIWALFRAGDPGVLKRIAERIPSADQRDSVFACSLLNLGSPGGTVIEKTKLRNDYLKWLGENTPFLVFTGESPQFSSRPVACAVDFDKKYVSAGAGFDRRPLIGEEDKRRALQAFAGLSEEDKKLLSDYSLKRRKAGASEWSRWLSSPLEEQLDEAKAEVL